VAFQPVRYAVQRTVNRLMYGERDEPRAMLQRLGATLDESAAGESVLPRIATTIASALRLPYVAVVLGEGQVFAAGKVEDPATELLRIPLSYQGVAVGELHLAPRSPRDPFTPGDVALLRELAVHIGVASHAVLLATQLQQSRERLVNARAEERRRLRRDLHDGLGPQLVSLALKLEAARNRVESNAEIQQLMTELAGQTRGVIADVRRLVYALRPPALDELGLLGALEQAGEAAATTLHFEFEKPAAIPQLPAAVEVATYRIAQEALTNVVRHSGARSCKLRLTMVHGGLNLEVTDDGSGMLDRAPAGIGLNSMRERAEELGGRLEVGASESGGSRVAAFLPCVAEA
jgi:signal transduction histidine kinase